MSEFHPNRLKKVRTRPALTKRRILESWPLLVWLVFVVIAVTMYRSGVRFSRMNGAVDPYQENIAPAENGRLKAIHVKRGQIVKPGELIATMDSSVLEAQLASLLRGVASDRDQEIRRLEGRAADLRKELRQLDMTEAEDRGRKDEIDRILKGGSGDSGTVEIGGRRVSLAAIGSALQEFEVDRKEIEKRLDEIDNQRKAVNEELRGVNDEIQAMRDLVERLRTAPTKDLVTTDLDGLKADEQREAAELQQLIKLCELRTVKGGRVGRLEKEVGEPVLRAEGITKVIADPEEIVAFLPQEHIGSLKVGDRVWVTAARDPTHTEAYETVVESVSPRVDGVLDASSPLPNQRIWGREIAMKYPEGAKPKFEGDTYKLLPGQTVVVHTTEPGGVPWLDRIFPNDDRPGE